VKSYTKLLGKISLNVLGNEPLGQLKNYDFWNEICGTLFDIK
jgi:hypothetical protein